MIYTVTLNPALDLVVKAGKITLGEINRVKDLGLVAGGKGINVSMMLASCGVENKALGFAAGISGEGIVRQLVDRGVSSDFVWLKKGFSRINVKLEAEEETEINCDGPDISQEELTEFFEKLDIIPSGSTLVLAGNIPKSLPDDIYEQIMQRFSGRGIKFAVDAAGERLKSVLKYKPFVIKPNNLELEELFGVKINSADDIRILAQRCQSMGAENVIVSLGSEGSVLLSDEGIFEFFPALVGKVINTVGAGDSMLAGFIAGKEKGFDSTNCMLLATACGSATCFSVGIADSDFVNRLYSEITAEEENTEKFGAMR